MGKPTVTLSTKFFETLAERSASARGMPDLRQIILPFPLDTMSEEYVQDVARAACAPIAQALTGPGPSMTAVSV